MDFKEKVLKGVKLINDFEFNGRLYPAGYEFTIIGNDSIRGLNIQDQKGNIIYEIALSNKYFQFVYEYI